MPRSGHYYFIDTRGGRSMGPRCAGRSGVDGAITAMKFEAKDGKPIEAFLALPVTFSGRSHLWW
jgi:hypothetical protein